MEPNARDVLRRGVRAAVYRACWRRLEGDEPGAQALLACELPAALAHGDEASRVDDEVVRAWLDEDTADFDRAVLISDLVARRARPLTALRPVVESVRAHDFAASGTERPARPVGPPAIADLLDGMLAQERRPRAAS